MKKDKQSSAGFTVIEMLVGLVILAFIGALIAQFFMANVRASEYQKGVNDAEEAARIALSLMTWDFQNAGYRVNYSATNPAIIATSNGYDDSFGIRFRNDTSGAKQQVDYSLGSSPVALLRAQYDTGATISEEPTVASIVAMNIQYETRSTQYNTPTGSGNATSCPAGSTPLTAAGMQAATYTGADIINCFVNWTFQDTPDALVRQVNIQLLARSDNKVPRNQTETFTFDGTDANGAALSYTPEAGYAYKFVEQTVMVPNLSR